jgi:hypothetical protein
MLLIRAATVNDVALLRTLIRELAEFERQLDLCVIKEEDLLRDGFGEKPKFRALIAEWSGQTAGYALFFGYYSTWVGPGLYLEDVLVRPEFREKELEWHCWLRWRGSPCRKIAARCDGKCSIGMSARLNCTNRWGSSSAMSGGRSC